VSDCVRPVAHYFGLKGQPTAERRRWAFTEIPAEERRSTANATSSSARQAGKIKKRGLHMREFMILIGTLVLVAMMQVALTEILDELNLKRAIKVVNIVCVIFCYFLLARFVYNHIIEDLMRVVNYYF
jgi:hypothetical protein